MKITFSSESKMVRQVDQWVYLDGERFEFWDLCDTLSSMDDGVSHIVITDERMIACLKKLKVIEREGSRRNMMAAWKGPEFQTLLKQLKNRQTKILDRLDREDK